MPFSIEQTISSPVGVVRSWAFTVRSGLRGLVVEPSSNSLKARLLIAQSMPFLAFAFVLTDCAVAYMALRGFQQFTRLILMQFLVATFAECDPIAGLVPKLWVIGKRLYMMRVQQDSMPAAFTHMAVF